MINVALVLVLVVLGAAGHPEAAAGEGLGPDTVLVLPTNAYARDQQIIVPVNAWVYAPRTDPEQHDFVRSFFTERVSALKLRSGTFRDRTSLFAATMRSDTPLTIEVAGQPAASARTASSGLASTELHFPDTAFASTPSPVSFQVRLEDGRAFPGEFWLPPGPTTPIVVSDIDDTIKVSEVLKKPKLMLNTFFRQFKPVEGMAALYREQARVGARTMYVSASPWQLYPHLKDFLDKNGFPAGEVFLKPLAVRDWDSLHALLVAKPCSYKREVLEKITERFRDNPLLLVGDSGEMDPEAYGVLARLSSGRVQRILIRKVGEHERVAATRFETAFDRLPKFDAKTRTGTWEIFNGATTIKGYPAITSAIATNSPPSAASAPPSAEPGCPPGS